MIRERVCIEPEEICRLLGGSEKTQLVTKKYKECIREKIEFTGRKPSVLNAGIFYFSALQTDFQVSCQAIENLTGIRQISIKKIVKDISESLREPLPEKYLYTRGNGDVVLDMRSPHCRND